MAETDELAEEETNSNRSRRLEIKSVFVSETYLKNQARDEICFGDM